MKSNWKNKSYITIMLVFYLLFISTSCSNEVNFGEQYKKTVYIVNSNDLLYVGEHYFETQNDAIIISVYCASTIPVANDLTVRLKINRQAIDSLNYLKNLADPDYTERVMLPEMHYQIDGELYLTIKAGEQYGTLKIPFNPEGLDPTIPYALPLSLVSNNSNYDINHNLKSIVYEIEMISQYSGNYSGSSQTSPTAIVGIQPSLKALSYNSVRLPIHNLSDEEEYLLTNYMVLKIFSDNSVTISPLGIADVTDLGGSTYDPVRQSFELHFQFVDSSANLLTVTSIIRNINAPLLEDDE